MTFQEQLFKVYADKFAHFTIADQAIVELKSKGFEHIRGQKWVKGRQKAFLTPLKKNGNYNGYLVTWGEFRPAHPVISQKSWKEHRA